MTTSTCFLAISKTGKTVIAYQTKFAKAVGDRINIDGVDLYIFSLEDNLMYAKARLGAFTHAQHFNFAKRVLPTIIK